MDESNRLVRQQNRFLAIMNSYNRVLEIQNELTDSAGTTNLQYSRYLDSVEAASNRAKVAMEQMWIKAINTDLIKYFFNLATVFITIIDKVGAFRIAIMVLIVALSTAKKSVGAFVANLYYIPAAMVQSVMMGRTLRQTLFDLSVAFNLAKVGAIALQAALTFGISIAISLIIEAIIRLVGSMENARRANDELLASYRETISQNNAHIRSLQAIASEYDNLSRKTSLTVNEQKRLNEIQNEIARLSPSVVQGWDEQGNAIINLKGNVAGLIRELKEINKYEASKLVVGGENAFKVMFRDMRVANEEIDSLELKLQHLQGTLPMQELIHITSSTDLFWEKNNAGIKQYKEALEKGIISEREYIDVKKKLENKIADITAKAIDLRGNIDAATNSFRPYMKAVVDSSDAFEMLTEKQRQLLYDFIENTDRFGMSWDEASSNMRRLISVVQTANFQGFVSEIEDINNQLKDGNLSAEEYEEEFNKIIVVMSELFDLDPEFLAEIFKRAIPEVEELAETAEDAAKRIKDSFDSATSSIDLLTKAQKELKEHGQLSMKTLMEIADKHEELIIPMLEKEGNMRKVLHNAILEQEEKAKEVFREKLVSQLQDSTHFFNEVLKGNKEVWGQVAQMYGVDQVNFANVAEAKRELDIQVRRIIGEGWKHLYSGINDLTAESLSNMIAILRTNVTKAFEEGLPQMALGYQRQIAELEKVRGALSSISTTVDIFMGGPIKTLPVTFDNVAKSASKALKDPYEEWLKEAEKIANEVVKIIQDSYRKQKKIALAAIKEEQEALEKAHKARIEYLDKEYKRQAEIIDLRLRAIDDEADEGDFQRELMKLMEERGEIESNIAKLVLDNSYEAKAKREALEVDLAKKIEEIDEKQRRRSKDLRKQELNDQKSALNDELNEKKTQQQEMFDAEKERLERIREETTYHYDELINNERYFAKLREEIISGNLKNVQAKLNEFIKDFKKVNKDAAYEIGVSFQELLNIMDRANAAMKEMKALGSAPAKTTTAKSTTTATATPKTITTPKATTPKQTTVPKTTAIPKVTTPKRPTGTNADYDRGYTEGYANGYYNVKKRINFDNVSLKYEEGYNKGYTQGSYDQRSYFMMHEGGVVEAHKGRVIGGGRKKIAKDLFSIFDEPLKPDEVLAKLRIDELVLEPSIAYPTIQNNLSNLFKGLVPQLAGVGGPNVVSNLTVNLNSAGEDIDGKRIGKMALREIYRGMQRKGKG